MNFIHPERDEAKRAAARAVTAASLVACEDVPNSTAAAVAALQAAFDVANSTRKMIVAELARLAQAGAWLPQFSEVQCLHCQFRDEHYACSDVDGSYSDPFILFLAR